MAKPEDEEFVSQWNQASAWAQQNDIPTSTLAPVYQYDLQRMQDGDYPMSQAERIRAIQWFQAQAPQDENEIQVAHAVDEVEKVSDHGRSSF